MKSYLHKNSESLERVIFLFIYYFIFTVFLCLIPLDFMLVDQLFKKIIFIIISVALIVFCGTREIGVDRDSYSYFFAFNSIDGYLSGVKLGYEFTFSIIAQIVKYHIADNVCIVFLIYAIFSIPLKIRFILKYSSFIFLSLLFFYSFMFFKQDFTAIRVAVATGIFLWACDDLFKKEKYKFCSKILLAIFFHASAMVYLLCVSININKLNKNKYLFILWSIAIASNLQLFNIFNHLGFISNFSKVEQYSQKVSSGLAPDFNPHGIQFIMNLVLTSLLILFSDTIIRNNSRAKLFLKLTVIGNCMNFIFGPISATIGSRLSDLFLIITIITYTYFIYFIKPRIFGVLFCILIAIIQLWFNFYYIKIMYNYHSWLIL